jgi:DNA-binding helix-hairpin-helix protein with protein kinase domain
VIFFDHKGQRVRLGREVARGGEGAVFEVNGDERVVAKLYLRPPDEAKRRKLSWMAAHGTAALLEQTAWPSTTLHRAPGQAAVGFLMQRIAAAKPVHLLYSPASRANEFPDRDWGFLLAVASNIASVFETVHAAGHLVGDVNERNVLVSPKTGVARLIDCDSFQIHAGNVLFPCDVGVARFTPPELQNRHLRVERTVQHDAFSLAVLLFHLVYLGRHPFDGVYLGKGEMTSERAIAEHRFAYGKDAAARQMKPPPIHLPFRAAPEELTELFERAFSPSQRGRPAAGEWSLALRTAARNLRRCGADRLHVFSAELAGCPFCQLTATTGALFFVAVDSFDFKCKPSDIAAFTSFARETQARFFLAPLPPAEAAPEGELPQPLASELAALRLTSRLRFAAALFAVFSWCVFLFGAQKPGLFALCASLLVLAAVSIALRKRSRRSEARRLLRARNDALVKARRGLVQAQHDYLECAWAMAATFKSHLAGIESLRAAYESLEPRFEKERKVLADRCEELQRTEHLRAVLLSSAAIQGFAPGHKQVLRSFGIETAYDVLYGMPDEIKGLGEARRTRLHEWALSAARSFHFDPKAAIPPSDVRALVTRFRKEQAGIRARMEDACEKLRKAAGEMGQRALLARERVASSERAVASAQAIVPVSDDRCRSLTRRRFYERGFAWGALATVCAVSGIVYAVPSQSPHPLASRTNGEPLMTALLSPRARRGAPPPRDLLTVPPLEVPNALPSDCALRAGPDSGSARLSDLPQGTLLTVETRKDDGWLRVRTSSQNVGWTSPSCWNR